MVYYPQQAPQFTAQEGEIEVLPNFPNPFIEMTMLRFKIPNAAQVVLRIFNSAGQEVQRKSAEYEKGEQQLLLQRVDLSEPGVYEYQIETPQGQSKRRKLMMF
jgi:hypothetical protein